MISQSSAETTAFAAQFAATLKSGDVVALTGPLGAGKTCFVQGLARGLGVPANVPVNSPTFILCNIYQGRLPLNHFDWYRLTDIRDLDALGCEEYFDGEGITVVEWADKFPSAMPERTIWIQMEIVGENERKIEIQT